MNNENAAILIILLATYISFGLNIPILRQFFGFLTTTFLSGFLILRFLKKRNLNLIDNFLFSVSLSLAVLIFTGVLLNALLPLFSPLKPLTFAPLVITTLSLPLALLLLKHRRDLAESRIPMMNCILTRVSFGEILFFSCILLLVFINVIGAIYTKTIVLLATTAIMALFFMISMFLPRRYHYFLVFVISVSLLFQTSLISRHLMGWDIFAEYHVFKVVEINGQWKPPGAVLTFSVTEIMNSVVSTTILPTVYSVVLGLDGELVLKIIYPFLFSLVILFLYRMFNLQFHKSVAIVATLFFVSNSMSFYGLEALSLAREMIGYLFFAALVLSLINGELQQENKRVFFIIFSTCMVLSHYSISFIFLGQAVFAYLYSKLRRHKTALSLGLVLLFAAVIFLWYLYVACPPINKMNEVIHRITQRFTSDFLESHSRLPPAYENLSPAKETSLVGIVHKVLIYVTHGFIVIGAFIILFKPQRIAFNNDFHAFTIFSLLILSACLVIPNLAPAYNFSRFYRVSMLFLSPLFVFGGVYLLRLIRRISNPFMQWFGALNVKHLEMQLLALIIVVFFVFRVGFVNNITGEYPISYSLDFERKKTSGNIAVLYDLYSVSVTDQEVSSAVWLSKYMNRTFIIYCDSNAYYHILHAYAIIGFNEMIGLHKNITLPSHSYCYLTYLNTQMDLIVPIGTVGYTGTPFNFSEVDLLGYDHVYANEYSNVLYVP